MPTASDPVAIRIEGELTIFHAGEWMATLLASPPPTEVDLSGVTEIDTAGLQLLMLAKKKAKAERRQLKLVAHSAAVTEVFELLNLAAYFGDPLVVPSRESAAG